MTDHHIDAEPLHWPPGWKRGGPREDSRFKHNNARIAIDYATQFVLAELDRMGVGNGNVVISSNLRLRNDGLPYSSQRQPEDKGVAVWWKVGEQWRVLAVDQYERIADNIYAIGKTINAMRGIDRWGKGEILTRVFTGFAALPHLPETSWREVLGIGESIEPLQIRTYYRQLINYYHPDKKTGDNDKFIKIKKAYEQAKQELGF